jgi:hypothetical protein
MTFNGAMASMLVVSLVLCMIGLSRNLTPPIPSKTRWGWFVLAGPLFVVPFGIALYRLTIQ